MTLTWCVMTTTAQPTPSVRPIPVHPITSPWMTISISKRTICARSTNMYCSKQAILWYIAAYAMRCSSSLLILLSYSIGPPSCFPMLREQSGLMTLCSWAPPTLQCLATIITHSPLLAPSKGSIYSSSCMTSHYTIKLVPQLSLCLLTLLLTRLPICSKVLRVSGLLIVH